MYCDMYCCIYMNCAKQCIFRPVWEFDPSGNRLVTLPIAGWPADSQLTLTVIIVFIEKLFIEMAGGQDFRLVCAHVAK